MTKIIKENNPRPSIFDILGVGEQKPLYSVGYNTIKENQAYIDVETTNDITKGETTYPYDIHITIMDCQDKVLYSRSFIVSDIFDDKICMEHTFYRDKIPHYNTILDDLNDTKENIKLRKLYRYFSAERVLNTLNKLLTRYNVKVFHAFNGKFDYQAILNLYYLKKINNTPFFRLDLIDTREMFLKALIEIPKLRDKYLKWCKENGKYSEKGNAITNVETIYQFITKDLSFKEKHNGLDDTKNEIYIIKWVKKQYKKYGIELIVNFNNYYLKGYSLYSNGGLLKVN